MENQAALNITIRVDDAALKFPEKEGHRVQEPTFLTVLEDAAGKFIAGKAVGDGSGSESATTLAEMQKNGIRAAISLPVPRPGCYRVREVVREAVQNRVWASGAATEVR